MVVFYFTGTFYATVNLLFAHEPHGGWAVVVQPAVIRRPSVSDVRIDADALGEPVVGLNVVDLVVPRSGAAMLRRVENERRAVGPAEGAVAVTAGAEPHGFRPSVSRRHEEEFVGERLPVRHGREGGQITARRTVQR